MQDELFSITHSHAYFLTTVLSYYLMNTKRVFFLVVSSSVSLWTFFSLYRWSWSSCLWHGLILGESWICRRGLSQGVNSKMNPYISGKAEKHMFWAKKCNCFVVFRLIFLLWSVWLWTVRMAVHRWRRMERRESRAAPPTTLTLTSSGSLEKTWRSCHLSKMGWVSWCKRVWICLFLSLFFSLFS